MSVDNTESHYIWVSETAEAIQRTLEGSADVLEAAGLSAREGLLLRGDYPTVELVLSGELQAPLPDNLSLPGFRALVVSNRLRRALAQAGVDNVQYFPCLIRSGGQAGQDMEFSVANVVGRVAAVDRNTSRLVTDESDPNIVEYVDSLVLDQRATGVADLFRLAEAPHLLVASARVRFACEAARITGVRFQAVCDFSG